MLTEKRHLKRKIIFWFKGLNPCIYKDK